MKRWDTWQIVPPYGGFSTKEVENYGIRRCNYHATFSQHRLRISISTSPIPIHYPHCLPIFICIYSYNHIKGVFCAGAYNGITLGARTTAAGCATSQELSIAASIATWVGGDSHVATEAGCGTEMLATDVN